jgi:cytidylate kinase
MSIICISLGAYYHGKEIAEKVAEKLGYSCASRDVLLQASKEFNVPEIQLTRAIETAPSIFEKFVGGREKYLAFIEATLLERAQKDNMVYYGFAAQHVFKHIRHALHVRITASIENRAQLRMEQEKISHEEVLRLLKKIDQSRKRWGLDLYGIDLWDSSNYDLVIDIGKITVNNAVDTICHAAGSEQFKTTLESQAVLDELALAATMRAKLIPILHEVTVTVRTGIVFVNGKTDPIVGTRTIDEIHEILNTIPGVGNLKIDLNLNAIPV